uniref:Uncharacterized protein n=1 Tax=Ascaris lumbricoides TaxID=6252 RepID=A0A0M3I827_ASCLU
MDTRISNTFQHFTIRFNELMKIELTILLSFVTAGRRPFHDCRESEESIDDELVDFRRQAGAARSVYSSQPMNRPVSGNDKVQRKEDLCFRS